MKRRNSISNSDAGHSPAKLAALAPDLDSEGATTTELSVKEYYNTNNRLMQEDIKEVELLDHLPIEFLTFLEQRKNYTIHNCDQLFPRNKSPFFQITDGLQCNNEWPYEFQKLMLKNRSVILQTSVKAGEHYSTDVPPIVTPILYDSNKITNYQKRLLTETYSLLYDDSTNDNFNLIHIEGKAGCGKTYILSEFSKNKKIHIEYMTISNILCNDIKNLYNINTTTFCKQIINIFSSGCNLPFFRACQLQEIMQHILPEDVEKYLDAEIFDSAMIKESRNKNRFRNLVFKHFIRLRKYKKRKIFFLDEYTLVTGGLLSLFIKIARHRSEILNIKTVFIVAGDGNQIEPLFVTAGHSYKFLDKIATSVINFDKQMRVVDSRYNAILNNLLVLPANTIGDYLRDNFKNRQESNINYRYPIECVINAPKNDNNTEELTVWFNEQNIQMINLIFFAYTNCEVHYNNLTIAATIINQLKIMQVVNLSWYIQVHVLRIYIMKTYRFIFPIKNTDSKISILPLIRFFPYKLLKTIKCIMPDVTLARSSILYLIDWNNEFVWLYSKVTKTVHKIGQLKFSMNLYKNYILYGFPLQMHCSDTAHSLQGQTIDRDICINASKCSRRELYVMLSRVREASRVCRIFTPDKRF